jgi:hypothetical protein
VLRPGQTGKTSLKIFLVAQRKLVLHVSLSLSPSLSLLHYCHIISSLLTLFFFFFFFFFFFSPSLGFHKIPKYMIDGSYEHKSPKEKVDGEYDYNDYGEGESASPPLPIGEPQNPAASRMNQFAFNNRMNAGKQDQSMCSCFW